MYVYTYIHIYRAYLTDGLGAPDPNPKHRTQKIGGLGHV